MRKIRLFFLLSFLLVNCGSSFESSNSINDSCSDFNISCDEICNLSRHQLICALNNLRVLNRLSSDVGEILKKYKVYKERLILIETLSNKRFCELHSELAHLITEETTRNFSGWKEIELFLNLLELQKNYSEEFFFLFIIEEDLCETNLIDTSTFSSFSFDVLILEFLNDYSTRSNIEKNRMYLKCLKQFN